MVAAFLLAILAGFVFQRMNVTPEFRTIVLILLLGVLMMSSSRWLAFRVSEIRLAFPGLLSIFAINALIGVAVVWFGTVVGNWLWQLNLSR